MEEESSKVERLRFRVVEEVEGSRGRHGRLYTGNGRLWEALKASQGALSERNLTRVYGM